MGALCIAPQVAVSADSTLIDAGQKIAFDRKKGNCLACHQIADGKLAGNVGPPLIAMKTRFPDRAKLRAQIWDASKSNKKTMMPPFGLHSILNEGEIDKVVEFIYSL
ncbi:MAG: sulfur oxidation c-type cytochrome SoxX [Gammaproteobacteria bacterium]|nr:sulfur oxidation c-type cytochrome SoxX [Gammaproteobacteria bacterium]